MTKPMYLKEEVEFLEQFGKQVKKQRILKGMSQTDLAIESGIDRSYIGGIENGGRNITVLKAKQIADYLEIDLKILFDF